jgi:outer membrane protein OmpA-like peptidoglycan-associated protein
MIRIACVFLPLVSLAAQAPDSQQASPAETPVFRADAVSKSIVSINYQYRSGATTIGFEGTALMPKAKGEARVENKNGRITIDAELRDLSGASQFGTEYLTYVLWAITPDGRPRNLGEVKLDGNKSRLTVTTSFQAFGLVVAAEPYFSVTEPSDLVVLENVVVPGTRGKIDTIDAKYELLQRGHYQKLTNVLNLRPDPKVPIELYEARNAVQVARTSGADKYAADTFGKAEKSLAQAEDYDKRKQRNPSIMAARDAAQTAEDARVIAVRRIEDEHTAEEKTAAAKREADAKAKAEQEALLRAQADAQRQQADQDRQKAEQERAAADRQRLEAELAAAKAAQQKAESDTARLAAAAQEQQAREEAQRAQQMAQQAEQEKTELRATLLRQLNQVLETKDTDRGLVATMADVLFDTGKYTLRPAARERLARLAGIVAAHPGLKLEADGYTDSTGSDEFNQRLSERRAQAVIDYLKTQGLPESNLSSHGEGSSTPVAPNDTAAGRQKNRRVEIIVSGEAIGTKLSASAQ